MWDFRKNMEIMSNFNRTVLEGYLEFASETGTIWKLCVSTFKLHDLFCSSGKISDSKSKNTEQFKYLNKISSSEKFTSAVISAPMPVILGPVNILNYFLVSALPQRAKTRVRPAGTRLSEKCEILFRNFILALRVRIEIMHIRPIPTLNLGRPPWTCRNFWPIGNQFRNKKLTKYAREDLVCLFGAWNCF